MRILFVLLVFELLNETHETNLLSITFISTSSDSCIDEIALSVSSSQWLVNGTVVLLTVYFAGLPVENTENWKKRGILYPFGAIFSKIIAQPDDKLCYAEYEKARMMDDTEDLNYLP